MPEFKTKVQARQAVLKQVWIYNTRRLHGCHQVGAAKRWDATRCNESLTLNGHTATLSSVAFSPDGQRIITGILDNTAKVREAASGPELLTLVEHSNWIWSVSYSPDGKQIVTSSMDGTAKVWEAATPQQVAAWQKEEQEGEDH